MAKKPTAEKIATDETEEKYLEKTVSFEDGEETITGTVTSIDASGILTIETENGTKYEAEPKDVKIVESDDDEDDEEEEGMNYDPPLDDGIREIVEHLNAHGVATYESCQGGPGHSYPEPTVRFHGDKAEGYRAYSIAVANGLPVTALRRAWSHLDGELDGPYWEMTFYFPCSLVPRALSIASSNERGN